MSQPDDRYIEVQFSDVKGERKITSQAIIDTGADVSCITEYVFRELQLKEFDWTSFTDATGSRSRIKTCILNIKIGENIFRNHRVLVLSESSLIGWDILSDGAVLSLITTRVFSEIIHLLGSVKSFKQNIVLILGQDTTKIHRLRAIQSRLSNLGFVGIIVKDIADIEIQSTEEKVNMLGSLCRFVICENSFASGHIDELKICASNRFVTAVVQQEGLGATWMQADYPLDFSFIKTFKYYDFDKINACIDGAVEWAQAKVEERRAFFNGLYHWR